MTLKWFDIFHTKVHWPFQREFTGIADVEALHSRSGAGITMLISTLLRQAIPMRAHRRGVHSSLDAMNLKDALDLSEYYLGHKGKLKQEQGWMYLLGSTSSIYVLPSVCSHFFHAQVLKSSALPWEEFSHSCLKSKLSPSHSCMFSHYCISPFQDYSICSPHSLANMRVPCRWFPDTPKHLLG